MASSATHAHRHDEAGAANRHGEHEYDHDHGGHGHSHGLGRPRSDRAFVIGIAINLAFVAIEAWWGFRTDSLALLADAGHNLGDVAGLIVALAGAIAARRLPDARHTWGWKRASVLAAFINAMLLMVAVVSIVWAAVERLRSPVPIQPIGVMVVAAIGIVVNGATALLFLRDRDRDLNIRGAYLHMVADAVVSLGVVIAAGLVLWLGWHWIDPVVSLVIAAVILISTWGLFRDSMHLMFDGVPATIDLEAVRAELEALPEVERVHDLHVWSTGTTEVVLTAHVVTPGGHPDDAFFRRAAERMQERFAIGHVTLQASTEVLMTACDAPRRPVAATAH